MYYLVTVGFETERVDGEGNPRLIKSKFPVESESVEEVSTIIANYCKGDTIPYEILAINKLVIERVIDKKNTPEYYK